MWLQRQNALLHNLTFATRIRAIATERGVFFPSLAAGHELRRVEDRIAGTRRGVFEMTTYVPVDRTWDGGKDEGGRRWTIIPPPCEPVCTGTHRARRRQRQQRRSTGGAVSHLRRTQRLPDEDDAPFGWEKFRLLVPLGNVGRLYTGSSRPSASSFLPRISDSSDPASRDPGFFFFFFFFVIVWYFEGSSPVARP